MKEQLIAEFNQIRRDQKKVSDFKTFEAFHKHVIEVATKKDNILKQLERL